MLKSLIQKSFRLKSTAPFRFQPPACRNLASSDRMFSHISSKNWSGLDSHQRSVLRQLGLNSDTWDGRSSSPSNVATLPFSSFNTDQQGLLQSVGISGARDWDQVRSRLQPGGAAAADATAKSSSDAVTVSSASSTSTSLTSPSSSSSSSSSSSLSTFVSSVSNPVKSVASSVWSFVKSAAPMIAPILQQTGNPNLKAIGSLLSHVTAASEHFESKIQINDLETAIYLDDSVSMSASAHSFFQSKTLSSSLQTRLGEAKKAFDQMIPKLGNSPIRVVKFGTHKTVLHQRANNLQSVAFQTSMLWNASSGGTYMWHMIEQDVLTRFTPGRGKLRLCIITDGEDVMSPSGYTGMDGMNPMMRTLSQAGFDIEWFVIVVGSDVGDTSRYRSLALATGGEFLHLQSFDPNSPETRRFMSALASSSVGNAEHRYERQKRYELESRSGRAEKFDWYRPLELPGSTTKGSKK